jgi:hypothetical protein
MAEFLPQDRPLIGCERAADPRQHLRRRNRARPPDGVGHQAFNAALLGVKLRTSASVQIAPDLRGLRNRAEPLPGHAERRSLVLWPRTRADHTK